MITTKIEIIKDTFTILFSLIARIEVIKMQLKKIRECLPKTKGKNLKKSANNVIKVINIRFIIIYLKNFSFENKEIIIP